MQKFLGTIGDVLTLNWVDWFGRHLIQGLKNTWFISVFVCILEIQIVLGLARMYPGGSDGPAGIVKILQSVPWSIQILMYAVMFVVLYPAHWIHIALATILFDLWKVIIASVKKSFQVSSLEE